MAGVQQASYDDWRRVYGEVHDALPEHPEVACPNCGHTALRLDFMAHESDHTGYGMFWCDSCLFGIRVCRTAVPAGVAFHPMGAPSDELRKAVPEYTVVYPPSSTDPEDFDEVTF